MNFRSFSCAGLVLAAGALLAAIAACQSARFTRTGDDDEAGGVPLAVWRPGDPLPRFEEEEEKEEGRPGREVGPPPPGYWRIVGDEVPNWTPDPAGQRAGPLKWVFLGPKPIQGEYWSGNGNASGRVVSIATHPTDPLIAYAASASGGLWKTVDAGENWTPITDNLASLNHGVVAVNYANPDTVMVATGEYTTGSTGGGIFRSDDAGETWRRIGTPAVAGSRCSGLAIHPFDPEIVHVSSTLGYRRTFDGGLSWAGATSGLPVGDCSSLVMNQANPGQVFVARYGDGIYRSDDSGETFTKLTSGLPATQITRIVMAISRSDPQTLYAAFVAADRRNLEGLYKTTNGGSNWQKLGNTPNFPYPQAWYDLFVGVDPTDPQTVYCGGVSPDYGFGGVIKSTNGGGSWTDITKYDGGWIHPDMHAVAFGPTGTVWVGCDGGVWRSDDEGNSFVNCNATLAVTQHYNAALHPTDSNQILGGTQDNGTPGRIDGRLVWPQIVEGDGGFAAFDTALPARFYTTYVYLSTFRIFGGQTDITGPWGFPPTETVNFIAPLVMDPNDPNTLLGGTWRVWRTKNASSAADWEVISDLNFDPGDPLNAIAVAQGDSKTIYAGSSAGRVLVTKDAHLWNDRSAGLPVGEVSDVVVQPGAPGTAYVGYFLATGPRVLKTTNYGQNWTNVTGDMPVGPRITALAVDWSASPPAIFAGTGSGIYCSMDDGATWTRDGEEFPNVNIGDLVIQGRYITAATYGRGTWRANLDGVGPCEAPAIVAEPVGGGGCQGAQVSLTVEATGTDLVYQWFHDDAPVPGATGPTLVIESLDAAKAGVYQCNISNSCGIVDTREVVVRLDNLRIVGQPRSVSVCDGALFITFSFDVAGGGPIHYQWRKNGQDIDGATLPDLTIFAPGADDTGVYTCVATNGCGTVISDPASLAILPGPQILSTFPGPCTYSPGSVILLSVTATGTDPVTYSWEKDGQVIPGATEPTYTFTAQTSTDSGVYSVQVSDVCGTVKADFPVVVGCAADLNRDGVVDFIDYLEFLNFYDALDPAADLNCDGVIDFSDYLEFLNHFDAGC